MTRIAHDLHPSWQITGAIQVDAVQLCVQILRGVQLVHEAELGEVAPGTIGYFPGHWPMKQFKAQPQRCLARCPDIRVQQLPFESGTPAEGRMDSGADTATGGHQHRVRSVVDQIVVNEPDVTSGRSKGGAVVPPNGFVDLPSRPVAGPPTGSHIIIGYRYGKVERSNIQFRDCACRWTSVEATEQAEHAHPLVVLEGVVREVNHPGCLVRPDAISPVNAAKPMRDGSIGIDTVRLRPLTDPASAVPTRRVGAAARRARHGLLEGLASDRVAGRWSTAVGTRVDDTVPVHGAMGQAVELTEHRLEAGRDATRTESQAQVRRDSTPPSVADACQRPGAQVGRKRSIRSPASHPARIEKTPPVQGRSPRLVDAGPKDAEVCT